MADSFSSKIYENRAKILGPVLTALAVVVIHLLSLTSLKAATPLAPLMILTIYSTFRGGWIPGLISSVISCSYYGYSILHHDQYPHAEAVQRIFTWGIAAPIMVTMVSSLKRKTFQEHVQEGSRRRESFIKELTEAMAQLAWTASPGGDFNYFNQKFFEYTEAKADQVLGSGWISVVHPGDVAMAQELWKNSLQNGTPWEIKFRIKRGSDGSFRWHLGRMIPVHGFEGTIAKWVGTCLDIHDQRETLHALSETQTRLTSVLNRAPVAIWSADQNGIVTHSDGHGLEAMGLKPGQLVGASLQNLYQNDAEVLTNLKRAYQGKAFSSEVKIKDAWFETHFFPLKDSGGSITGIGGVSTEITARKTVQEERLRLEVAEKSAIEIKESQQFLDSLIEHLPSMVFVKEAKDLKYVRFNRAGEILTGHSREELIGRSDADFFPKEQAEFFNAKDREVLNNRVILTVSEETILTKFNGQRILRTKKVPILDSQGNPKYLMGISEDITDIKRVQEERDRFFTTSLDMLAVSGMDGYFKQVNPVVQTILGYTSEEFCRIPYMELVHPDDAIPTAKEVARQMGGDSVLKFENRYRCKDGGYKWLSWKSTPVGDLMYACARDVTEEKKVREQIQILNQQLEIRVQKRTQELEATVNKLNRLISSNMVGIMFWNNEGHITEANNAFLGMLGYTREDLEANRINWKGMTPSEYTERDAAARAELNSVGVCTPFEKEYLHKNGHRVPILIGAALFEGDANNGLCFVLDRTETKKASEERDRMHLSEQAAIAASKMKSTFLANMSHEIRTPINGVMGMTSLLIDTNLTGEQRNYAETIRSSAETLLTLVNDILDLTKAESGKIDLELICFDVKQVMADIERTLAFSVRKKGLQILHSISPDLPAYLKGDPTRLGQVLLNLVSNAIKFTAEGAVTIELKQEFRKGEEVGLLFEITDTGIGIPTESLERMFLSFSQADSSTTRRYGGTGLGLSISKHLVTLMGGKIGVRSTPGKGSTFWFTLPMTVGPSTLGDIPRLDSPEPSSQQKLRILIAEDNSVNQLIALKMLERLGHTAVAVANGQEVIDALNAAPYDMVFMDCQMPELDGYEATRKIRATTTSAFHGIPIVAMTANAMAGDREKCLASGMSDYISKPMKSRDLHNAIERAFMKNIKKAA